MKDTEKTLSCTCEQAHQDDIYGAGQRAHRWQAPHWVCTICGNEKALKAPEPPPDIPKAKPVKKANKP